GMGVVYRGRDPDLRRQVALKAVRADRAWLADEAARRFEREVELQAQLQHPNIVPVYDRYRAADGRPFLAMKLVEGCTLARLLNPRSAAPEELPHVRHVLTKLGLPPQDQGTARVDHLPRFLTIFEQVCQTVAYAHSRGVIH